MHALFELLLLAARAACCILKVCLDELLCGAVVIALGSLCYMEHSPCQICRPFQLESPRR